MFLYKGDRALFFSFLQARGFCCGLPAYSGSGYSCRWDDSHGSTHYSHPKGWSAWIRAAGSCPSSYACYNALSHPAYWWISVNNRYAEFIRWGRWCAGSKGNQQWGILLLMQQLQSIAATCSQVGEWCTSLAAGINSLSHTHIAELKGFAHPKWIIISEPIRQPKNESIVNEIWEILRSTLTQNPSKNAELMWINADMKFVHHMYQSSLEDFL